MMAFFKTRWLAWRAAVAVCCLALAGCHQGVPEAMSKTGNSLIASEVGYGGCDFPNPVFDTGAVGLREGQAVEVAGGVLVLEEPIHGIVDFWPDASGHRDCFIPIGNVPDEVVDSLREASRADQPLQAVRVSGRGAWQLYQEPNIVPAYKYWRLNIVSASSVEIISFDPAVISRKQEIIGARMLR